MLKKEELKRAKPLKLFTSGKLAADFDNNKNNFNDITPVKVEYLIYFQQHK